MVAIRWLKMVLLLTVLMASAGCSAPSEQPSQTPVQPTEGTPVSLTPTAVPPQPTATEAAARPLWIWVPPQFDPNADTQQARLFRSRLDAFETENPDVLVQVRVKAASGAGGLLEALSATRAAAPGSLPSLVILPRLELESAALKGLIYPLDNLTTTMDDPDWYNYARELSLIYGSAFGIPFAGDALVLAYRSNQIPEPPRTWSGLMDQHMTILFPATDPASLLTLDLYLSAGGSVMDADSRPMLDAEILSNVLSLYYNGYRTGVFPALLLNYSSDDQSWQAFKEGKAQWVVTWSSQYLSDPPADTAAIPLPSFGEDDFTLARGWVWAVTDMDETRRQTAVRLIEYLTDSDYLTSWTYAAGYLPVRPSTLAAWPNPGMRTLLSQITLSAKLTPSSLLLSSISPALSQATLAILTLQSDPVQAAENAADSLNQSIP